MKASVSTEGIDPGPIVEAAVTDLLEAGDAKFAPATNAKWRTEEELSQGRWSEGDPTSELGRRQSRDRQSDDSFAHSDVDQQADRQQPDVQERDQQDDRPQPE